MTQEAAAKKDIQRLQRAIIDGLEDVKAQDIAVFNTEHLSPLFERVIIASGTSNRQTKALASSVRDAVREAGFPKPRIEGEANGEWIIVDCGAAVAHVMQPAIRTYYHLEEIWGDKPVRLKFGAAKPGQTQAAEEEEEAPAKKSAKARKTAELGPSLRRSSAAKTAVKAAEQAARDAKAKPAPRKSAAGKTPAGKTAAGSAAAKAPAKRKIPTVVAGKPAAKKTPAKSAAAGKAPAKKAPAKRAPGRKA